MHRTRACFALIASLALSACCFEARTFDGVRIELADLRPAAQTLVLWPADADATRFRYLVSNWEGDLDDHEAVHETDFPARPGFFRDLPESLGSAAVLLPATDVERLRPRADAFLAAVVERRPSIATSIVPTDPAEISMDLLAIEDAAQLSAALQAAGGRRVLRAESSFGRLAAMISWLPHFYVVPLEEGERYALLSSLSDPQSPRPDEVLDWDGLVDALEHTAREGESGRVPFIALVPERASDEIHARIERLMDWPEGLDLTELYWARSSVPIALAPDATAADVLSVMSGGTAAAAHVAKREVRSIYDLARVEAGAVGPHPRF